MFPIETRILTIDDSSMMRGLVRKYLSEAGYTNITEAENAEVAWEKMLRAEESGAGFQLIISDVMMPGIDGIELLERTRAKKEWRLTPFVILTAESEKTAILRAVKARVSNYIMKPFTSESLLEKLNSVHDAIVARASQAKAG